VVVAASSAVHHFFVLFGAAMAAFGLLFVLVGLVIRKTSRGSSS
jgi:hypothetical protein